MEKIIIAAVSDNGVIGNKGKIPWYISGDLKYFHDVTLKYPVIMGSRTYESIGHPLSGRINIVVSHKYTDNDVFVEPSLERAYDKASEMISFLNIHPKCFVIGGAQLYNEAIKTADTLYITQIHKEFDGDTFFPNIDANVWKKIKESETKIDEKSGISYNFIIYKRICG